MKKLIFTKGDETRLYEAIENIAIHNIEVLELLEDYLGNINKLRIPNNNDKNFIRICKFTRGVVYNELLGTAECNNKILFDNIYTLLQQPYQFPLNICVNVPITAECFASLYVAGK